MRGELATGKTRAGDAQARVSGDGDYRLKSRNVLTFVPTFTPSFAGVAGPSSSVPPMNAPIVHATVRFSGHVQGVGFRYATLQVAKEFEVAGFVKNEPDGTVLVEAEGRKAEVDGFIAAIGERMHGHVRKMDRVQQTRAAVFQGFEIR
jgi:acylphosphatase